MNADPLELQKFSELAHRWWDPESEFRPLHQINPLRLDWINEQMPLSGKRVVDIGCGGGLLSEAMAAKGARVSGIDLSEKALNVARLHLLESGEKVDYRLISAEQFAAENEAEFDVVTCMEMLEHVPDPLSIVQSCAKLLKPGGMAFFSTLNRNPKTYLLAIIGAEYLLGLLPKGTHDYSKFITPAELSRQCRTAGLVNSQMSGLGYNPLNKKYYLEKNCDVNYMISTFKPA